jgi:hypothetical protein
MGSGGIVMSWSVDGRVRIMGVLPVALCWRVHGQAIDRGLETSGAALRRVNGHLVHVSAHIQYLEVHGCNTGGRRGGSGGRGVGLGRGIVCNRFRVFGFFVWWPVAILYPPKFTAVETESWSLRMKLNMIIVGSCIELKVEHPIGHESGLKMNRYKIK